PKAVPGNMRPNTTSAGNWKIPTRAMAMKPRMERLSTTRPKKTLKSPATNQRRGAAEAGADMEGAVGVGTADGRPSGAWAPIPSWNDGFQPSAGPLVAGLVAESGFIGVGRAHARLLYASPVSRAWLGSTSTADAGRSPASSPLLLKEVVHQQMLHIVEAA